MIVNTWKKCTGANNFVQRIVSLCTTAQVIKNEKLFLPPSADFIHKHNYSILLTIKLFSRKMREPVIIPSNSITLVARTAHNHLIM